MGVGCAARIREPGNSVYVASEMGHSGEREVVDLVQPGQPLQVFQARVRDLGRSPARTCRPGETTLRPTAAGGPSESTNCPGVCPCQTACRITRSTISLSL